MKKIFILILLCILLIPTIVDSASIQMGKFKYMPAFEEETEEVYYYSDDYFKDSGKTINDHLLAMSYNLAISTFEIRGYSYSKALLEEIGFKDFQAFDMEEKPTLDTIGMVISHKEVNGKNLIAVAIRGEKYDSEWGNNFIVGKSGNAKGFDDSSIKVINRIKSYIEDNNLANNKIWIAGYSRAGAIANLTGVYINNHLNEFSTNDDDLYVYTFEAPAASVDDTVYDNIYTVRNENDLIPFVYPKEWGLHTNGKVINIGEVKTIKTYIGLTEQEEYEDIEIKDFCKQFFGWLASRLDRDIYSEYLEEPLSKILDIYFSKSADDREKLKSFFLEDVKSQLLDNEENFNKIKGKAWSIMGHNSDYLYHSITDDIIEIMNGVRNSSNGQVLTDDEYNIIINSLYPVLRVLGPIIIDDTNYYDGINYDDFYTNVAEDYSLTDEEMGYKFGYEDGKYYGYEDGLYDNPRNEYSFEIYDDYGPSYDEAYANAFINAYLEYYELGQTHKDDIVARGKYDGAKYAYDTGYYNGSHGEESIPYDEYFYTEDWMTDEYINAYNEGYSEEYLKGYNDGLNNPASDEETTEPEQKNLYHFASIFKSISDIIKMHYPQENLRLIHLYDSYYYPYDLTDGANQIVTNDDEQKDNLVFKTSGPLEKLVSIQVDGKDLNASDYELKSGSTILTLKDEFVKTLEKGKHTLAMEYIDNKIETTFEINSVLDSSINNPNTSDSIVFYVYMLITSIVGFTSMLLITKKINRNIYEIKY